MGSDGWFRRARSLDVRVIASAAAALFLIGGVMWIFLVPRTTTPDNFNFESSARRDLSSARVLQIGSPTEGRLVDGSDYDFYRIGPLQASTRIHLHMSNGSPKLIPAVLVFDEHKNTVLDKTADYLRNPGADVDGEFMAQANTTYYIQVFSQRNTTGAYTLSLL